MNSPAFRSGARRADQFDPVPEVMASQLDQEAMTAIDEILTRHITALVGPEFMIPPDSGPAENKP